MRNTFTSGHYFRDDFTDNDLKEHHDVLGPEKYAEMIATLNRDGSVFIEGTRLSEKKCRRGDVEKQIVNLHSGHLAVKPLLEALKGGVKFLLVYPNDGPVDETLRYANLDLAGGCITLIDDRSPPYGSGGLSGFHQDFLTQALKSASVTVLTTGNPVRAFYDLAASVALSGSKALIIVSNLRQKETWYRYIAPWELTADVLCEYTLPAKKA